MAGSSVKPLARIAWAGLFFLAIQRPVFCEEYKENQDLNWARLYKILGVLNQVPTGKTLIQKALKNWKAAQLNHLMEHIRWSDASRTDTVLTRHFSPSTGKEERVRNITVFLKEDQVDDDILMDLAHELVHATSRPGFDPYDPSLTPAKYITAAIDGEGGEVQAVLMECQVGTELLSLRPMEMKRCQKYLKFPGDVSFSDPSEMLDPARIQQDFYRVGGHYSSVVQKLGGDARLLPFLSNEAPQLFSSTGQAPYPVALLREYEEINELACDNTRKRAKSVTPLDTVSSALRYLGKDPSQRKIASEAVQDEVQRFMNKRCTPSQLSSRSTVVADHTSKN